MKKIIDGIKSSPIIFNLEMIQAILAGKKTVTRRQVKPNALKAIREAALNGKCPGKDDPNFSNCDYIKGLCHYGGIGDQIWVKETSIISPKGWLAPDKLIGANLIADPEGERRIVQYLANNQPTDTPIQDYKLKKTPSIFMPKWASRIHLEITNVRIERLQDITDDDAKAEGCDNSQTEVALATDWLEKPARAFNRLWCQLYGEDKWNENPYVWVISFKVIKSSP